MKIVWYLATLVLGAFSVLFLGAAVERAIIISDAHRGVMLPALVIGLASGFLAWRSLQRARRS